jgi:hydrogenase expression/formation protein HypC
MCLALPGKVISIDESNPNLKTAKVNFNGVVKDVTVQWIDDLKVGDYVIVHVGFALNKIDEKEAIETFRIINEMVDLTKREGGE